MRGEIRGGGGGRGRGDMLLGSVCGTERTSGACFEMSNKTFITENVTTRRGEGTAWRGEADGTVVDGGKRRHNEGIDG